MKHKLICIVLTFGISASAWAGIRTYEEATQSPTMVTNTPQSSSVSNLPEQKQPQVKPKKIEVEDNWNKIVSQTIANEQKQSELIIYLSQMDVSDGTIEQLKRLRDSQPLKELKITPSFMQNDMDIQGVINLHQRNPLYSNIGTIFPNIEIYTDYANDYAQAHNITEKSTIVYRDPTGAVRMYSLAYEVDKLERQIKREAEEKAKIAP